MKAIRQQKKKIFDKLLKSTFKDVKLYDKREAQLVSLTFEKTFELLNKMFETELRNNYYKKRKPKVIKLKKSRLENIQ
jgi:hypothetical protein